MSACSFVGVLVYWPGGGVVWWCSGVVVCVVVSWCIVVYTSNCRSRIVQTQDCTSRSMIISSVGRGTSSAPRKSSSPASSISAFMAPEIDGSRIVQSRSSTCSSSSSRSSSSSSRSSSSSSSSNSYSSAVAGAGAPVQCQCYCTG